MAASHEPIGVERLATLEQQVKTISDQLRDSEEQKRRQNEARELYQNTVLEKLIEIRIGQESAALYQKTCEADRDAHGNRLAMLEKRADSFDGRTPNTEKQVAENKKDIYDLKLEFNAIKNQARGAKMATVFYSSIIACLVSIIAKIFWK